MARPWRDSLPNIRRHPLLVGNVLASFPLRKSRAKEPLEEEPIPLVRRTLKPPASERLKLVKMGDGESVQDAVTQRRTIPPEKEDIELVAPGMFRLPVSDDALTHKVERPTHRDAIPPKRLPAFDVDSVESFEIVPSDVVTTPKRMTPSPAPPEWNDDDLATAELKSPEELRGEDTKSHISISDSDIIGVADDDELKSPQELRRSTRPPMTGEVPEDQPLFSLMPGASESSGDDDTSVNRSLKELGDLELERRLAEFDEEGGGEAVNGDSSVSRSLKDLENLEVERQLIELEEEEKQEAEAKRIELLRVLKEKQKKMEAEEKAKKEAKRKAAEAEAKEKQRIAAEEAKKAEEEKRAQEEAAQSDETEEEILVEVELGILWEDEHTTYRLTNDEIAICEQALPNRQRRYILPVPEEDEKGAEMVKMALKDEDKVRIAGKSYFIMDMEFAGAKIVARVGNVINVWPHAATNYEFLGKIGVDTPEYDEVEWSNKIILKVRDEEKEIADGLIPQNRPVLLHPVPAPYTKNPYNLKIMKDCSEVPIADIDGDEYYVLEPENMAVWREIVFNMKKARMADRSGDSVSLWSKAINGYILFSGGDTCHLGKYGEPCAPLIPKGHRGIVEPYNAEVVDIMTVYADGERTRYLYPMPDKISGMDADTLRSLMVIATGYVDKENHSPLISLRGRWYMALEFPWQGARKTSYEDGAITIHSEDNGESKFRKMQLELQQKREENEAPIVKLPSDPEQRVRLMQRFPEHKSRYLLAVAENVETQAPDVWIKNGDEATRYLVFDKPVQGAFEVKRVKDDIKRT